MRSGLVGSDEILYLLVDVLLERFKQFGRRFGIVLIVACRGQVQIANHLRMRPDCVEVRAALASQIVPIATGSQRQRILLVAAGFRMSALVGQAQIDGVGVKLKLTKVERR